MSVVPAVITCRPDVDPVPVASDTPIVAAMIASEATGAIQTLDSAITTPSRP